MDASWGSGAVRYPRESLARAVHDVHPRAALLFHGVSAAAAAAVAATVTATVSVVTV